GDTLRSYTSLAARRPERTGSGGLTNDSAAWARTELGYQSPGVSESESSTSGRSTVTTAVRAAAPRRASTTPSPGPSPLTRPAGSTAAVPGPQERPKNAAEPLGPHSPPLTVHVSWRGSTHTGRPAASNARTSNDALSPAAKCSMSGMSSMRAMASGATTSIGTVAAAAPARAVTVKIPGSVAGSPKGAAPAACSSPPTVHVTAAGSTATGLLWTSRPSTCSGSVAPASTAGAAGRTCNVARGPGGAVLTTNSALATTRSW